MEDFTLPSIRARFKKAERKLSNLLIPAATFLG
jgi:hypothetical protein